MINEKIEKYKNRNGKVLVACKSAVLEKELSP